MNTFRTLSITATAVAAITVASAGLAHAAPTPTPANPAQVQVALAPGVNYRADIVAHSVVISTDLGSFTNQNGRVQLRNSAGTVVAELPLTYQVHGQAFPIDPQLAGHTATLTPRTNAADARPAAPARAPQSVVSIDQARQQAAMQYPSADARNAAALGTLVQQATLASITGAMIGTIIGGVAGCALGATVLTAATVPLAALLGAGPIAGCAAGALMLGPVGTMAGTIFVGAPILAYSAFQYFNTVNSPFKAAPATPAR